MTEPALTRTTTASGPTALTRTTTAGRGLGVRAVVAAIEAGRRTRDAATVAAHRLGQTVTAAGWLVLAFATAGIGLGWAWGWVEWLAAGVIALALLVMSAPFLFGARGYDVALHLPHERVTAGEVVEGEILIQNVGARTALPGRVDLPVGDGLVELGVPLLRPGHRVAQPVTIPALRRGVILVGPATAVRTDPIGLLRREHEWEDARELYVHPRTVPIPATSAGLVRDLEGNPSTRLVDADMSFHAIREYAAGDSRRQIHWKSTAKTGQLMVRQFEESLRSRLAVVLGVADGEYATDDEFELAVGVAASLALRASRDGRDLEVVTGSRVPRAVRGRLRAIDTLPAVSPRMLLDGFSRLELLDDSMPLAEVCRLAAEASDVLSLAFVVCGSPVTVTRLRQAALAFPADTAVVAVVCDEGARPKAQPLGGLTVLTVGVLDDLTGLLLRGVQT